MPGNGPPPAEQRRRRNADTYADVRTTVAAGSSTLRGQPLEVVLPGHAFGDADELVRRWWDTWRRSPLTEAWLDTDWSRLAMVAPLVASYYLRPHHQKLAEIRQNESLLGATHVDRLKARIKVERDEKPPAPPAGVTALDAYRRDLAG